MESHERDAKIGMAIICGLVVLLSLLMIPVKCAGQCVDTQYVAPSGKVVRVTNNCVPPDDCYHYLYPSGFVLDSMYTAADARYWAERCQAKLITITLTKGCPTCGRMERVWIGWADVSQRDTVLVNGFPMIWKTYMSKKTWRLTIGNSNNYSVCKRCGTVYRGRR